MTKSERKRSVHGGGSVFQRKNDQRWVAKFKVEETGKWKVLYANTEKEAKEKLQQALFEQKQGILATGPKQTVKQYFERWLEIHQSTIKVSTYALYRRQVRNHIIRLLGHIQLRKLTADQVQGCYAKLLKEHLSPGTVRTIHGILCAALSDAVRWKHVPRSICESVTPPRVAQPDLHPLTKEQSQKLLETAKGHRLEGLLTMALVTGMRRGELLSLRWQDIDFEHESVHIKHTADYIQGYGFVESEPKTPKSRRKITLPQIVLEALKEHRMEQAEIRLKAGARWHEHDFVFCNRYGDYLRPGRIRQLFEKLLSDAGLPHVRFHDLRHSAATIMLTLGIHPKVVQEILGHSSIGITLNTYSHVLPSMQQEAMGKWNDIFPQNDQRDGKQYQTHENTTSGSDEPHQ